MSKWLDDLCSNHQVILHKHTILMCCWLDSTRLDSTWLDLKMPHWYLFFAITESAVSTMAEKSCERECWMCLHISGRMISKKETWNRFILIYFFVSSMPFNYPLFSRESGKEKKNRQLILLSHPNKLRKPFFYGHNVQMLDIYLNEWKKNEFMDVLDYWIDIDCW